MAEDLLFLQDPIALFLEDRRLLLELLLNALGVANIGPDNQ